jgi:predicted nucleic acid-binding protein
VEPAPDKPDLADTSVWVRSGKPGLESLAAALGDGRIAVCDQVVMEVLWSARDLADFRATRRGGCSASSPPAARCTTGRSGSPALLIAAVATRNGLTVLHNDCHHEIIASVTGQPTRWAAPRGTI